MANKHRGEIDCLLGGQHFTLRPTFDALVEFEDKAGMTAYEAMRRLIEGQGFSAKSVAAAIYCGMKAGWPVTAARRQPSFAEIGGMIQSEGLSKMAAVFGDFLTKALSSDADLKRMEEETAKGKEPAVTEALPIPVPAQAP